MMCRDDCDDDTVCESKVETKNIRYLINSMCKVPIIELLKVFLSISVRFFLNFSNLQRFISSHLQH